VRHHAERVALRLGGMTPYPVQSALKHFPEDFGIYDDAEKAA